MTNHTVLPRTALSLLVAGLLASAWMLSSCGPQAGPGKGGPSATRPAAAAGDAEGWKMLFDGKTLTGWKVPDFGGQGKVYVKDGCIHMEMGDMCTGVTFTGAVPREDYEVCLEMMRQEGNDFPCALTFPVGKDPLTFVIGGWGGTVTGVSCIDGYDASDNQFSKFIEIENKKWYPVMVRVTKDVVECFFDGKQLIEIKRSEHKFSIRPEVEDCVPLGVATWKTHGVVKNIRVRTLK